MLALEDLKRAWEASNALLNQLEQDVLHKAAVVSGA